MLGPDALDGGPQRGWREPGDGGPERGSDPEEPGTPLPPPAVAERFIPSSCPGRGDGGALAVRRPAVGAGGRLAMGCGRWAARPGTAGVRPVTARLATPAPPHVTEPPQPRAPQNRAGPGRVSDHACRCGTGRGPRGVLMQYTAGVGRTAAVLAAAVTVAAMMTGCTPTGEDGAVAKPSSPGSVSAPPTPSTPSATPKGSAPAEPKLAGGTSSGGTEPPAGPRPARSGRSRSPTPTRPTSGRRVRERVPPSSR